MSNLCLCLDSTKVGVETVENLPLRGQITSPFLAEGSDSKMSTDQLNVSPAVSYGPTPDEYKLIKFVGKSNYGFSKLFVANHGPSSSVVFVKQTDVDDQDNEQLDQIKFEVQVLRYLSHPNILSLHCVFVNRRELWMILPYMAYGSASDMIKQCFTNGMPEPLIALLMEEMLQGLDYIHKMGFIHRGIKGSHILVDKNGRVCLEGLQKSIYLPQGYGNPKVAHDFPSHAVHCLPWMAPEILQQNLQGYDSSADIYSVGITCIELAHGMVPYTGLSPTEVLLEKLTGLQLPRLSDTYTATFEMDSNTSTKATDSGLGGSASMSTVNKEEVPLKATRKFSTAFHRLVDLCLRKNYYQRPSANALLSHAFFKQAKRKTKETLPEMLSSILPAMESEGSKNIDQEGDIGCTANTLASLSLDEWIF